MVEPTGRPTGTLATRVVVVVLAGCVVLTVCRWLGPDLHLAVLVASFGFLGLPGHAAVVAASALLLRRGDRPRAVLVVVLAVALVGTTLHAAWLAPLAVGEEPGSGDALVVATLNLRMGGAEPAQVAAWLASQRPDVAVLTEVTPAALVALQADPRVGPPGAGRWPFRAGRALPQAAGTVVLSAHGLSDETEVPLGNRGYEVTLVLPSGPLTLTAVHAAYPLRGLQPWRTDLATLRDEAARVRGRDLGPHVMVGDLNATRDHRAFREVLDAGLRDASEQAGSGWQPTWPTPGESTAFGVRLPAALLTLDHVLVSPDLGVEATSTQQVSGTDHLALVARLVVPRTLGRR